MQLSPTQQYRQVPSWVTMKSVLLLDRGEKRDYNNRKRSPLRRALQELIYFHYQRFSYFGGRDKTVFVKYCSFSVSTATTAAAPLVPVLLIGVDKSQKIPPFDGIKKTKPKVSLFIKVGDNLKFNSIFNFTKMSQPSKN